VPSDKIPGQFASKRGFWLQEYVTRNLEFSAHRSTVRQFEEAMYCKYGNGRPRAIFDILELGGLERPLFLTDKDRNMAMTLCESCDVIYGRFGIFHDTVPNDSKHILDLSIKGETMRPNICHLAGNPISVQHGLNDICQHGKTTNVMTISVDYKWENDDELREAFWQEVLAARQSGGDDAKYMEHRRNFEGFEDFKAKNLGGYEQSRDLPRAIGLYLWDRMHICEAADWSITKEVDSFHGTYDIEAIGIPNIHDTDLIRYHRRTEACIMAGKVLSISSPKTKLPKGTKKNPIS